MQDNVTVFQQRTQALSALQRPEMGAGNGRRKVEYSSIKTGTESLLWEGAIPAFPGRGYPLVPAFCYRFFGAGFLN